MQPYREIAIMEQHKQLAAPMMKFMRMETCGRLLVGEARDYNYAKCPKCDCSNMYAITKVCKGKRLGRCGVGCGERREHFHIKCDICNWSCLMETKDAT
jgi:hypothetical protein